MLAVVLLSMYSDVPLIRSLCEADSTRPRRIISRVVCEFVSVVIHRSNNSIQRISGKSSNILYDLREDYSQNLEG